MTPGEISALQQDRDWYRLQRDDERMRMSALCRLIVRSEWHDAMATAQVELARISDRYGEVRE